ncbi:hypothetical protein HYQ46_004333 [Verticillium longisporum]|nr:hypothetical protein HYQ46_004333 [Verticillium longisporum]
MTSASASPTLSTPSLSPALTASAKAPSPSDNTASSRPSILILALPLLVMGRWTKTFLLVCVVPRPPMLHSKAPPGAMMPAPMTRSAWMGMVPSTAGSAAFSSAAEASGPPLSGDRMGTKAARLASSSKWRVW